MKANRINWKLFLILLNITILCGCTSKTANPTTAQASEVSTNTAATIATTLPATSTPTAAPTQTSEPTPTPTAPAPEPVPLTEENIQNIQMITTAEFFPLGTLIDAEWSPDGKTIIVLTNRDLQVVDAENLEILHSVYGYELVQFLDDGNLLLRDGRGLPAILDMQQFKVDPVDVDIPDVDLYAVSYDGKVIADVSTVNVVKLIDIESGESTEFTYYPEAYTSADPLAVTFSPDQKYLYISRSITYELPGMLVFDLERQELLCQEIGIGGIPTFSPDGKRLVFETGFISLYTFVLGPWFDLSASFKSDESAGGEYFGAKSYSFIQDSSQIGILYRNTKKTASTIIIYNTNTGTPEHSYNDISPISLDVGFSPDGSQFFTLSDEGYIQIYQTSDGALLLTSQAYKPETDVAVSPDGSLFAYYTNTTVRIVSCSDGELVMEFTDHNHSVWKDINFQGNDKLAINNYFYGKSQIDTYEIATGEWIRNYPEVGSCMFNSSGNTMICALSDFELYDTETGQALVKVRPRNDYEYTVSDDGAYTAFCNVGSETVFLYDTRKGTELQYLRMGNQAVCGSLDFSADGQYLVSSIGAVWKIPEGDLVLEIPNQGYGLVNISTNNEFVLFYPFVHSLQDGSLLAEISQTGEWITNAWFHPNGYDLILLSGNTIQFWGVLE